MEKHIALIRNYGDYLTVEQTAEYLGVSKGLIYTLLRKRRIKGRKVGRSWRISKLHIINFLEK